VIETAGWRDVPDAILLALQPGQEAGNSIVDVLSGKVNPSGKLADSFPLSYSDVPSAGNFPGKELESGKVSAGDSGRDRFDVFTTNAEVVYEEDIYLGYRYYNTFDKDVAYEFGYGLSYTTFEYDIPKLSSDEFKDVIKISIDVKNAGPVAGKEVVQVYLSAPAEILDKPREELVAFAKTGLLEPGQSQTLSFELVSRDLASFVAAESCWIAEAGQYKVKIGASSRDIRQTAAFSFGQDIVVRKVNRALSPQKEINRLHPF
jgi:beta-glucosidase